MPQVVNNALSSVKYCFSSLGWSARNFGATRSVQAGMIRIQTGAGLIAGGLAGAGLTGARLAMVFRGLNGGYVDVCDVEKTNGGIWDVDAVGRLVLEASGVNTAPRRIYQSESSGVCGGESLKGSIYLAQSKSS